jgi:hypothetical protein
VKLTIKTVPPVPVEEVRRNVANAKRLGFPRMGRAKTPRLAVVGGGPSIKQHIEELKFFDGDVWAINGAFQWCRENGIDAWFFSVDPNPVVATFCEGARRAFVAMDCHPDVFRALSRAKVEALSLADIEHGPTTSTAAPVIAAKRGYSEVHFFGCEGSFDQTTHAYGDYGLDGLLRVKCNGEEFHTTADMMIQVEYLGQIIKATPGFCKDRSGGLLSAYIESPDIDVLAASPQLHKDILDGANSKDRGSAPDGGGGTDERAVPRLDLKRPKPTSILICVPAGGQMVSSKTTESLFATGQFLTQQGIRNQLSMFSAADIEDIRNLFLTYWYDTTDFSHLLFVDADMGFHPMLIRDMMVFNEPLMGVLYARRQMPASVVGTVPEGHSLKDVRNGFIKATGLGCGVMMISREVIDNMLRIMPELSDDADCHLLRATDGKLNRIIHAFDKFRTPMLRLSEDMAFCHRWQLCGGEIWANIDHKISHVGPFDYHLRYQGVMESKEAESKAAA